MEVLWMGLIIFIVICTSLLLVMGIAKGLLYFSKGSSKSTLRSGWMPLQVYSGDDALDHPDLQKIAKLQEPRED